MKPKIRNLLLLILALLLLAWFIPCIIFNISRPQLKWNWSKIRTDSVSFPKGFIWGVATAAHQVEGYQTNNQWYLWESTVDSTGNPMIARGQIAGMACDHWRRYPQDIRLMKELGVKSYRFSVEWSRIEPREGVFDSLAIRHYQDVCDSLIISGITPMVTLHHFTNPIWFEKKGAFEKLENVADFVKFTEVVYMALKDRVQLWCTINEPAVYVVGGYFQGDMPPGKKDPKLAALVLRNILEAHVQAYWKIKSLPGGDLAKVGVVKNMTQMDPYRKWHLGDWIFANLIDGVFNGTTLKFLKTGEYRFNMPTMARLSHSNPKAAGSMDFIGLNYYSHYNYKFSFNLDKAFQARLLPGEVKTDMDYASYPEGFYRAIKSVSELGVPIIITENGVADAKDDKRARFISQYLYAVSKAVSEGYDIKGYYYWTLMDNFEWSLGYDMKFGLYSVDMPTQIRRLKPGAKKYQELIQGSNKPGERWSAEKAKKWADEAGWLTGANFTPSSAINQLEFWQAETFDPATIDRELGWAESIGFNTVRTYLHHLAWETDPIGFFSRVDQFLAISSKHHIKPVLVIFDDCWNAVYAKGKQPDPKPGVHNSGWVQDPGAMIFSNPARMRVLEDYTTALMSHFADDERILLWDLYNEPGNSGYGMKSMPLLRNVFRWARMVNPSQPVSAGLWARDLKEMNMFQAENSDIITYHNYSDEKDHAAALDTLRLFGRPLICTEYMARTNNSRFENILPLLKEKGVGAINWGLVSGKTNTIYAWSTPIPDGSEPPVWFHDIFRADGTPYDKAETDLIKKLNAQK